MNKDHILELDQLIHAPIRLAIMSALVTVKSADFNFLKENTRTSDGNLSTHLTKLEKAGYISIKKFFEGKKPRTSCSMTDKGKEAFHKYLDVMQTIISEKTD